MSDQVTFVRIRGRVIPIRKKKDERRSAIKTASVTAGAAFVGGNVATQVGISTKSAKRNVDDLLSINAADEKVSGRAFASRYVGNDVHIISNGDQLGAFFSRKPNKVLTPLEKRLMDSTFNRMTMGGKGGAALRNPLLGGKIGVAVGEQTALNVISHELGHVRDMKSGWKPSMINTGFLGRITGAELRSEKRAWDLAPAINSNTHAARKAALSTYVRAQRLTRFGAALGASGALWMMYGKKGS